VKSKIVVISAYLIVLAVGLISCAFVYDSFFHFDEEYAEESFVPLSINEVAASIPQEQTWYEAYTALLMQYQTNTAHLPAEEGWLFALHDISGNGIPELIIWESTFGSFFFAVHAAYSFANSEAQRLEITEDFGGRPASIGISSPPNGVSGLVVRGGGEGFMRYMLVTMDGNRLIVEVCATLSVAIGSDIELHYVRGIPATELPEISPQVLEEQEGVSRFVWGRELPAAAKLPDIPYWWQEEHERKLSQGYEFVTMYQLARVVDGVMGGVIGMESPLPITQENIRRINPNYMPEKIPEIVEIIEDADDSTAILQSAEDIVQVEPFTSRSEGQRLSANTIRIYNEGQGWNGDWYGFLYVEKEICNENWVQDTIKHIREILSINVRDIWFEGNTIHIQQAPEEAYVPWSPAYYRETKLFLTAASLPNVEYVALSIVPPNCIYGQSIGDIHDAPPYKIRKVRDGHHWAWVGDGFFED